MHSAILWFKIKEKVVIIMEEFSKLTTEMQNEASMDIDDMSTIDIITTINNEDHQVAKVIRDQLYVIADASILSPERWTRVSG